LLDRVARGHRQIGFAEQYFTDCGSEAQVNAYVVQAHARNDTDIALIDIRRIPEANGSCELSRQPGVIQMRAFDAYQHVA
jgi:hypothetical protein